MRLIIGMCGASGIIYAVALLKELKKQKIETHLIVSEWAGKVAEIEAGLGKKELEKLADHSYSENEMGALISSSSFIADGMIVIPASIKTVSEIATAHTGSLISRCADIMLRTRKKLVVCVRETPLSTPALENLSKISQYGGIVMPLSPGFYNKPKTLADIENFMAGKVLDIFSIQHKLYRRWKQ